MSTTHMILLALGALWLAGTTCAFRPILRLLLVEDRRDSFGWFEFFLLLLVTLVVAMLWPAWLIHTTFVRSFGRDGRRAAEAIAGESRDQKLARARREKAELLEYNRRLEIKLGIVSAVQDEEIGEK